MGTVTGTNLKIEGHRYIELINHLNNQCNIQNYIVKTHLLNAGRVANLKIMLSQTGGKCGFNEKTGIVEISWDVFSGADIGNAPIINCVAETALFELHNGINKQRHQALDDQLNNNRITFLQRGLRKAIIESESSIKVAQIISSFPGGYKPSGWGEKQVDAYTKNQGNFGDYFANRSHEKNSTGKMHLKSKHLYAYETKINWKSLEGYMNNITNEIKKPNGQVATWDDKDVLLSRQANLNGLEDDHEQIFYYIRALNELSRNNWNVDWNEDKNGDWMNYTNDLEQNRVSLKINPAYINTIKNSFVNALQQGVNP